MTDINTNTLSTLLNLGYPGLPPKPFTPVAYEEPAQLNEPHIAIADSQQYVLIPTVTSEILRADVTVKMPDARRQTL